MDPLRDVMCRTEGKIPVRPDENVCFVISGGSIGQEQLDRLKSVQ